VIDEVQLAPELFRTIKVAVDTDPAPGRSCSPDQPRCQRCAAFAHGSALSSSSTLRKRDYLERVTRGGYLEAIRRSALRLLAPARRALWRSPRTGDPRDRIRHTADDPQPVPRAADSGLPDQADPRMVRKPDPARHRNTQADLRGHRHRRPSARLGRRVPHHPDFLPAPAPSRPPRTTEPLVA
jgi:hypothetical protein